MLNCSQQTKLIFNGSFAQNLTASKLGWSPTPQALYSSIMWRDNVSTWITLTGSRTRSWVSDCGRSPRTKSAGFRTRSIRLWPPTWLIHRQAWTWWVHQCWIYRHHHLLKIPHVLLHFSLSFSIASKSLCHTDWPILGANWSAVAASMRYCPSRPTMFSETADVFGNDDDPLTWVFWTCATGWQEGVGGNGADRTEICPVEKASEDGKGGPRLLGNMARNHQNCQQRESKYWKYPCWNTRDPRDSQKTHLNRWESDQTELSLRS